MESINLKNKICLITGANGQDGMYLSEFLLSKNYIVHGIVRRSSVNNLERIKHLIPNENFILHYGDMTDSTNLMRLISEIQPDEIYNLAAQSHVQVSFEEPEYTANTDAIGPLRILESIRILGLEKKTKFYQASTSEMYGKVQEIPQTEKTPFYPVSPYGSAKLYAHWIVKNYRESYGIFACSGILFNHESPVRGEEFVTRKITLAVAKISLGLQDKLKIGNINAERDWGHSQDYVRGMWLMLQKEQPDDYVLATNSKISVRKFIELAFSEINVEIVWYGEGLEEVGINKKTGDILVEIDEKHFRPNEVDLLIGDYTKARTELNWEPKITIERMVRDMVNSDILKFS